MQKLPPQFALLQMTQVWPRPAGFAAAAIAMPLAPVPAGMPASGAASLPGLMCRRAIANVERLAGIPDHLLAAIARVESGRRDPQTGVINPWPWSINVEGQDHVYDTEPEAIAAVRMYQAQGRRSIDVGCLQVNLMYHPDAFASLEQAFDPQANAVYGAKFLTDLYRQTGSWTKATANYHSATPELGAEYQSRVMAALPQEQRTPAPAGLASTGMSMSMGMGMSMQAMAAPPPPPARVQMPHMIMMNAAGGGMAMGRTLESYRAMPVRLAMRR